MTACVCRMHGEEKTFFKKFFFFLKPRNPDMHGSIILKWILKTVCDCMHWIRLAQNRFLLRDVVKMYWSYRRAEKYIFFSKYRSYLNVLGVRKVTGNDCHTENPQLLGESAQTLAGTATWRTGSIHSWYRVLKGEIFLDPIQERLLPKWG
jgi:hypothetical protein